MLVFIHLPTMMCRTTNVDFKSSKQSIESNSIQRHTMEAGRLNTNSRSLKRVFISNRTITCNDGSQAGFYLRKSTVSKKWVVFLEGGWHCYDLTSCRSRWMRLRHLMTSTQWPEIRDSEFDFLINFSFFLFYFILLVLTERLILCNLS